MSNIGDPRNNPRHDEDCEPRPFCEGCAVKFEDARDAALTDGVNLWCAECKAELEKEAAIEAMIAASPMGAPMTAEEAMQVGIAAIFEGNTLLNGNPEECDICDEPRGHEPTGLINREDAVRIGGGAPEEVEEETTVQIEIESMDELVNGRRGEAA